MTGSRSKVSYVVKIARWDRDGRERYREEIVEAPEMYRDLVAFAESEAELKPGERVVSICEAGYH